ncbi:TonB-dependent receptor [Porticoccus sp. GXU_MW_L64]
MKPLNLTRTVSLILTAGLSAYVGHAAVAEEAKEAEEEIVITAQLREQKLQDVPVAVTAFSANDIQKAGIGNTQDFIDLTPNVSLDDSFTYGNTFVSIRGVSQINNADSPVAIVVDGVPQNNQKQFKMNLFDIERIEVLKGPQGSLYGRNAIGGAISIISKKPSDEIEGFTNISYGNGGHMKLTAGVSGGLVEDLVKFRLAGSYLERDGLINNTFLNTEADFVNEDYALRGNLLFNPSDSTSIDLRLATASFEAGSSYDVVTNSVVNPGFRSGGANTFFAPDENNLGITNGDTDEVTIKIDTDLGGVTFTSITNYTDLFEGYTADLDFSNPTGLGGFQGVFGELAQAQNLDVQLLSQELRFVSAGDQAFRWIGGVFYIETDRQLETLAGCDNDPNCAAFLQAAFGLPFTPPNDFTFINRNEDNDNKAWSVFGQIEYDLSDVSTIQFGLRYDKDEREQLDVNGGGVSSDDFDAWQPKVTYNYRFSEDVLGYATYSTGFRSGGFNAPGLGLAQFEDEYLQNLEFGLKSTLLDGDLIVNAALFASESDDYQFFFVDASTAAQFIGNLDEVSIIGFDADIRYNASDSLQLFGGIGITETDIDSIGGATAAALTASGVDISLVAGSRVPKNTPVTYNFGGEYTTAINDELNFVARLDFEHRGKKYWQIDNLDVQNAIDLIGLRFTVQGESWSATLWGENLSDEEYYTDYNPAEFSGSLTDIGFPAQPRTYGVDLNFTF